MTQGTLQVVATDGSPTGGSLTIGAGGTLCSTEGRRVGQLWRRSDRLQTCRHGESDQFATCLAWATGDDLAATCGAGLGDGAE